MIATLLHLWFCTGKVSHIGFGDLQIVSVCRFPERFGHLQEAPNFTKTSSVKETPFKTAVDSVLAFKIKEQKKCTAEIVLATQTTWPVQIKHDRLGDCLVDNPEFNLYLRDIRIPYEHKIQNEYDLPSSIKNEAKEIPQQTTKLEAQAFAKMDSIFFSDLNGLFDLDTLPDYPWIDDTEFPVQNLENIPEPDVITAQEVLEETILSPAVNLSGTIEEVDQFFPEEFMNLTSIESNMNSFNTDALLAGLLVTDNVHEPNVLGNFFIDDVKDNVECYDATQTQNDFPNPIKSLPALESAPEPITDYDTTAVVPNVVPASPVSVPDSPIDCTDSGALPETKLNPAILALLEKLEESVASNSEPHSRKRALAVKEETPLETPACKKRKLQSNNTTDGDTVPDKVVERRIKNNAASRVCRASRKARHQELFQLEKELSDENKVLVGQVEELTATVAYLRSYLVNKLKE